MSDTAVAMRTSGRVILLNAMKQVLLIRFAFPQSTGTLHFWATPGGGAEADESTMEAAARELKEELGVAPVLTGPVFQSSGRFEYEGRLVDNTDIFYVARWNNAMPQLTGVTDLERTAMKALRWWSMEELNSTAETVYPTGLLALLQRLL